MDTLTHSNSSTADVGMLTPTYVAPIEIDDHGDLDQFPVPIIEGRHFDVRALPFLRHNAQSVMIRLLSCGHGFVTGAEVTISEQPPADAVPGSIVYGWAITTTAGIFVGHHVVLVPAITGESELIIPEIVQPGLPPALGSPLVLPGDAPIERAVPLRPGEKRTLYRDPNVVALLGGLDE